MIELTKKDLTAPELAFLERELDEEGDVVRLDDYKMNFRYSYEGGSLEYEIEGFPNDLQKKIGRGYRREGNKSVCGPFRIVDEKPAPKRRRGRPKKSEGEGKSVQV